MRPKPPLSEEYEALLSRWRVSGVSAVAEANQNVRTKVLSVIDEFIVRSLTF